MCEIPCIFYDYFGNYNKIIKSFMLKIRKQIEIVIKNIVIFFLRKLQKNNKNLKLQSYLAQYLLKYFEMYNRSEIKKKKFRKNSGLFNHYTLEVIMIK